MKQDEKPANFKEAFCAKFKCAPEEFVKQALLLSYFNHAVPVARLLYLFKTKSSRQAIDAVIQFGNVQTEEEVHKIFKDYLRKLRRHRMPFLVRFFRIRLSGRRMLDLFVAVSLDIKIPEKTIAPASRT